MIFSLECPTSHLKTPLLIVEMLLSPSPKKGITLTCKKANNTRFSAMSNPDTPDFISEFPEVFPSKKITELQPLRKVNHHINLNQAKSAPSPKMFTVADKILPAYRQIIEDWKGKQIIYPCESQQPCQYVPQAQTQWRNHTYCRPSTQERYYQAKREHHTQSIHDSQNCGKSEISIHYRPIELLFQIRVAPEDEILNTIKTPCGTFACKVMLQGDTHAPSTAMRVMKFVLDGVIGKSVWAYLDDITIFSDTKEDHI